MLRPFAFVASAKRRVVGAALLGALALPIAAHPDWPAPGVEHDASVDARFQGCEAAGWCRFAIEAPHPSSPSLYRVRPDGVVWTPGHDALSLALRDRLNALLASMIHQHKRIVLHDLRELDDGTFAATVTVNGHALASDPILLELRAALTGTTR